MVPKYPNSSRFYQYDKATFGVGQSNKGHEDTINYREIKEKKTFTKRMLK